MLRNLSLRWKFLSIISIPMILLIGASSYIGGQATHTARQSHTVERLAQLSVQFTSLVQATQNERDLSEAYISGQQPFLAGKKGSVKQQLDVARSQLDQGVQFLDQQLGPNSPFQSVSPTMHKDLLQLVQAYKMLPKMRAAVDARVPSLAPINFYTQLIAGELTLPGLTAQTASNIVLQQRLYTYEAALQMGEATRQERNIIAAAKAAGGFSGGAHAAAFAPSFAQLPAALGILRRWEGVYSLDATPAQNQTMQHALNLASTAALRNYRLIVLSWPQTHAINIPMVSWNHAIQARLQALIGVQPALGSALNSEAHNEYVSAHHRQETIVAIALIGTLLGLVLTLALVRRMVQPLVALTETARSVSEELPRMVERMQEPGAEPDMSIGTIRISSNDEIGRLSDAFNNVNQVTIRVAQEQAALRGSIAEMFVNVARRNQALLGRQLSFIDELEQREEDPDALDNLFRLDHLATRMRRNAESLLVLAGIDDTRRLRRPVLLSDVVRTAVGEIEYFDRVDLSSPADPWVSGRVALSVAHMLAELIENATSFSTPTSRVQVSCRWHRDGRVLVTIADEGLGLSDDDLTDANERLARPPVGEAALSQRLGFLVVGRLARRLDAKVSLSHNPVGGTVANVLLPSSVFEQSADGDRGPALPAERVAAVGQLSKAAESAAAANERPTPKERFADPVATEPYQLNGHGHLGNGVVSTDQRRNGNSTEHGRPSVAERVEPVREPVVPDRWEAQSKLPKRNQPAATALGNDSSMAPIAGASDVTQPDAVKGFSTDVQAASMSDVSAPAGGANATSGLVPTFSEFGDLPDGEYRPSSRSKAESKPNSGAQSGQSRPAGLVRRTPGESTPANQPAGEAEDLGPIAQRNPGEVRGLLTAFRSGVERGRATPGGIFDGEEEYR